MRQEAGWLAGGWMDESSRGRDGGKAAQHPNSGEENGKFSWNPQTSVELELCGFLCSSLASPAPSVVLPYPLLSG